MTDAVGYLRMAAGAEAESAVAALRRALDPGFRDLGRPRNDELWASPRGDDTVREMLGIPDPGGLPRDEGWRADISFLAREIKRRGVAPFRDVTEADFDARVSLLADGVPGLSDAQIIAGMLRLLRPLADDHAFIAPAEDNKELNRVLPVKFYLFGEGLFVTAAAAEYRQLLGAEVTGVGEHPAGEVLAALDRPEEPLAAFCDRLFGFIDSHQVAGLVIDLRWNGGGNTLLVQPLLHHLIGCAKVRRPGGLFVIIGRGTFSAAQNAATAIERETSAIFVGEPSGSRPNFIGETMQFELPYSKTIANVSDVYWQTSWPVDQRPWIPPEIYTPPTFAAYRQNRDVAMEAILACHEHVPGG